MDIRTVGQIVKVELAQCLSKLLIKKALEVMEVWLHAFLTLALDGREKSVPYSS